MKCAVLECNFVEMSNRRIKAEKLFDGYHFVTGKILELTDEGIIEDILEDDGNIQAEFFEGILTPGFVNCHCHLELSHLKGMIEKNTGLVGFVQEVMKHRFFSAEKIRSAAEVYDNYMWQKGTVAVGDICNTADTIAVKTDSKIRYKNFIEATGFLPAIAEPRMNAALKVYEAFVENNLEASIVPHAPYSVSKELFHKINQHSAGEVISIHNQETEGEDLFFKERSGGFADLYTIMQADISFFRPSRKSSLATVLPYLASSKKILLVHNTFTKEEDIIFAEDFARKNNIELYWVLCANANLYIEGKLPSVKLFLQHACKICIGTDSLSSNEDLDILSEVRTLRKYFPELKDEILLKAICAQGASALGCDGLGKLQTGLQPGINLIDRYFNFVKKIY